LCESSFAQTPAYKHYDVSNGLPTNEVYEIKQDSKGFLWIGCDAGLVRYNGNEFKFFLNKRNRGNAITNLQEDSQGRIWCANFSGQVFFTSGDSLQLFEPWESNYKKGFAEICIDNKNQLFISNFANYIYRYNLNKPGSAPDKLFNDVLNKVRISNSTGNDKLFTLLDSGAVKKITGTYYTPVPTLFANGKPDNNAILNNFEFYNSKKNKNTYGIQRYNAGNPKPVVYVYSAGSLYQHQITAILQKQNLYPVAIMDDDEGNFFTGTNNELLWMKKDALDNWYLFKRLFTGNYISFIYKDREDNIWISTLKNGLFKIPNTQIWNVPISGINNSLAGINNITINETGVLYGSMLSGEVFGFNIQAHVPFLIPVKETRSSQAMEFNRYTRQLFLSKNTTFIYNESGTKQAAASTFLTNDKDFYFTPNGIVFSTGNILQAVFSKENKSAKEEMLQQFLPVEKAYYKQQSNEDRIIISEQRCKGVWYQQKQKRLWAGFVDGLAYYENKQPVKIFDTETKLPIIATYFDEDQTGNVYIATFEQGVYVVNDNKIAKHYTIANGLSSDRVKKIRVAGNYLWMVCGEGISRLNITNGEIREVTIQDGLLSKENYDVEVWHDTVYLASSAGLQYFPQDIKSKNLVAPVSFINSIRADDTDYDLNSNIKLPYATKNIVIELQGVALKSDGAFVFEYRLLPGNNNWIKVSAKENMVRYSSLAPGNYTFQSRVINEDGVVSTRINEIKFTIQKPWWQQWWFIVAAGLLILLLAYMVFKNRLRINQQKLTGQLEKSKVQEELRLSQLASLKAQMNPHFMFNALNSIQEFILLNDKRQANMYMGKFADMMRMILDMSNKDTITLDEELKSLDLYLQLEALRFEELFSYHIETDAGIDESYINMPAMIIQPYVENAIKHGLLHKHGEKKLTIHFSMENEHTLCCTVTDNGIGRKRSGEINSMREKKYSSFATGATQKRLELLNYRKKELISVTYEDLYDATGQPTGTNVAINIPV
jgi:ligand-binding sensor domain-containing protein/signal transduction histidine kinase